MHSWQEGGVILTAMTTTTADHDNGKKIDVVDKDNNKDPDGDDGKDNDDLIFI